MNTYLKTFLKALIASTIVVTLFLSVGCATQLERILVGSAPQDRVKIIENNPELFPTKREQEMFIEGVTWKGMTKEQWLALGRRPNRRHTSSMGEMWEMKSLGRTYYYYFDHNDKLRRTTSIQH